MGDNEQKMDTNVNKKTREIPNVPNLRFKQFTLTWKKFKLSEVCEINPKTPDLQEKFYYIDLESVQKGELIQKNIINKTSAPSRAQRVLSYNDICFQCVRPYQLNNYHFKILDNSQWVASTGYAQLRSKSINANFIYQTINSPRFNYQVLLRCTGSSYPAINSNDLGEIEIGVCSADEQIKIAHLLSKIDDRISTQSKIIEKLQSQMLAIYHQVFSQLNSEVLPLVKLCSIQKGAQVNGIELLENGSYYFMNGGIVPSGFYNDWNTETNTISISEGGNSCGYVQYNKERFWSGGHCYTLQKLNKVSVRYLYHFLKSHEKDIMRLRIGTGLPNIQKKDLEQFLIKVPSLLEQERLVKLLDSFELKIGTEEKLFKKYKEQKKFLLSNMFI